MVTLLYWSDSDKKSQMEFHEKSIYKGIVGFKGNQQL